MKSLRVILILLCISFFSFQKNYAQTNSKKAIVFKTTKSKTPLLVKESLKDYAGYKIAKEVTYTKNSNGDLYKIKVQKGNWSHFLLINEKGEIKGIETGEREH